MNPRANAKSGKYFQVPICLLAYGDSVQDRLTAIIRWGCLQVGRTQWPKLSEADKAKLCRTWGATPSLRDFNPKDMWHCIFMLGAITTGVDVFRLQTAIATANAVDDFVTDYEGRGGIDATVRIKRDLVFEARDNKGVDYRELSVLAAIYSVIGRRRQPVRITRQTLIYRALGYRSQAIMDAELGSRKDGAKPLTEWQLRTTLRHLVERHFVQSHTYGQRQTYFGVGMTRKEFREQLIELKTWRAARELGDRLEAKSINAQIQNIRAGMLGKPLPHPSEAFGSADTSGLSAGEILDCNSTYDSRIDNGRSLGSKMA